MHKLLSGYLALVFLHGADFKLSLLALFDNTLLGWTNFLNLYFAFQMVVIYILIFGFNTILFFSLKIRLLKITADIFQALLGIYQTLR